jgi:DNA-binding transcriptional LysR family regulator
MRYTHFAPLDPRMDFDQLNTFIEVARLGSFSRAADKVLRSQPAVSAQIRQLEQEYGHKLLDRSAKSVKLTPAGEVILEYAVRLIELRRSSLRAISAMDGVPSGPLTIGANEGTFLYVLPHVFAKYHRAFPKVRIDVYRSFTHKIIQKVEDGEIDLGLATLPVNSNSLAEVPVFRDRIMLMVSSRNPLAKRKSATLEEIANSPLILPKTGSTRKIIERYLRPYRENLNITMELTSVVMIKRFVEANFGISMVSASFARENVRRGEVKLLRIEGLDLWRELGLIYRKDRSLPRAASAFVDMAIKELTGPDETQITAP